MQLPAITPLMQQVGQSTREFVPPPPSAHLHEARIPIGTRDDWSHKTCIELALIGRVSLVAFVLRSTLPSILVCFADLAKPVRESLTLL